MKTERKGPAYFSYIRGNYRFTVFARCSRLRLRSVEEKGHDCLGKRTWYHVPSYRWNRIIRFLAIKMIINNGERFDFSAPEEEVTTSPANGVPLDERWVIHYRDPNYMPPLQLHTVRYGHAQAVKIAAEFAAVGHHEITTVHETKTQDTPTWPSIVHV